MTARILVVDDIEANRRLLKGMLEAKYHHVVEAADGRMAISLAREIQPDVILLDVMMPGLDGYETCLRLKEDPETAHIPVVMVTALNEVDDRVRGLQAGAEDFITKPVDELILTSRIAALTRFNAVASELRQREANGRVAGALDDREFELLNRPARILIVDTVARSSARMARILREAHHEVATFLEAGEIGAVDRGRIDLMVLSLSNQVFDPLKLCAHFNISAHTRAISIVVAFDPADRKRAAQALDCGASDLIQMPVEEQELLARVRTQARRSRYIEILRERVDRGMELAVIDQLTGLYNRRYMLNQVQQWMQRATTGGAPLSLVALDIDHFKQVNDTWGHHAGDLVLQELAARLKANVRPIDIVCRPGGEEFLVVMPETTGATASGVAERVRAAVAGAPFEVDGVPVALDITLSAGVAALASNDDSAADLMRRADSALYAAKESGRNRVVSQAA